MLTQTDLERERYEARRKAQVDHNTMLASSRLESRLDMIHFCERLLKKRQTPAEELARLSLEDLTRLAADLQVQVQERQ